MTELTKHEIKELKKQQKTQEKEESQLGYSKKKNKKRLIHASFALIALVVLGLFFVKKVTAPGPYDDFAKCLKEKGAAMYGADWCQYTQEQKGMFGGSFKYLDYHDYQERSDIKKTPTWIINGKLYERVQSFEKLSELTGCSYA